MSGLPVAHAAGIPIEEVIGMYGPVLLLTAGAVSARISARLHRLRGRRRRLRYAGDERR